MGTSNSSKNDNKIERTKNQKRKEAVQPGFDLNLEQRSNNDQTFFNDPDQVYKSNKKFETYSDRMQKRKIMNGISENTNNFKNNHKCTYDERRIQFAKSIDPHISSNTSNHNHSQFHIPSLQSFVEEKVNPSVGNITLERNQQGRHIIRKKVPEVTHYYPSINEHTNVPRFINLPMFDEITNHQINQKIHQKQPNANTMNRKRIQNQYLDNTQRIPIQVIKEDSVIDYYKRMHSQDTHRIEKRSNNNPPILPENVHYYEEDLIDCNQNYTQQKYEDDRRKCDNTKNREIINVERYFPCHIEGNQVIGNKKLENGKLCDKKGKIIEESRRMKTNRKDELEDYYLKLSQEHEGRRIPLSKYY